MTKPFSTQELVQKVREMLERGRLKTQRLRLPLADRRPRRRDGARWRMRAALAAVWATLEATERSVLAAVLRTASGCVLVTWLASPAFGSGGLRRSSRAVRSHSSSRRRDSPSAPRRCSPAPTCSRARGRRAAPRTADADARPLNAAAAPARAAARTTSHAQVAEASRDIEQERSRLAALMAELTQSVVVCNLDGRILLYNSRAPGPVPCLVEHAGAGRRRRADRPRPLDLRRLRPAADRARARERPQRLQRGAASPSAQFVTGTPAGQLLRVQMAPVRDPASDGDGDGGAERLRPDARQHHARLRAGVAARPAAARPDRGQPRLARQPAGGGRDARAARPRCARCASASSAVDPRRGRGDDGAPAIAGRRRCDRR